MDYEVRRMQRHELTQLKEMSDIEDWQHSLSSIQECYDLNPNHFYCAASPDGRILSTCGWFPLGGMLENRVAWIAFFVTRKEHRRKGIGTNVIKRCLESAGDFNIGLSATFSRKGTYEKLGFNLKGEYITCYRGAVSLKKRSENEIPVPQNLQIKKIGDIARDDLLRYDTKYIHPMPRDVSLDQLIQDHHSFHVAVEDGAIVGYGCVREGGPGYLMKPLYANSEQTAQILMNALLVSIPPEESIEFQVLDSNKKAQDIMERYGVGKGSLFDVQMFKREVIRPVSCERVYSMMDYNRTIV